MTFRRLRGSTSPIFCNFCLFKYYQLFILIFFYIHLSIILIKLVEPFRGKPTTIQINKTSKCLVLREPNRKDLKYQLIGYLTWQLWISVNFYVRAAPWYWLMDKRGYLYDLYILLNTLLSFLLPFIIPSDAGINAKSNFHMPFLEGGGEWNRHH